MRRIGRNDKQRNYFSPGGKARHARVVFWEAHYEPGGELDSANQLEEARTEFAEAVRLPPGNSRAHFNCGVLLSKPGHLDAARRELEETIRLELDYKMAKAYLAQLKSMKKSAP